MSSPSDYGSSYQCIGIADGTEVFLFADRVMFTPAGDIHLVGRFRGDDEKPREEFTVAAFAAGQWTHAYAASVIDGSAVAVEHWPGKISRD